VSGPIYKISSGGRVSRLLLTNRDRKPLDRCATVIDQKYSEVVKGWNLLHLRPRRGSFTDLLTSKMASPEMYSYDCDLSYWPYQ
jgi:hypothetical protein